jgi:uncharacterized protein (TIGR02266 family)
MAQDTRKDPRAKVLSMTVRYKSATVDEFIEHHSHDVSRGGIFIKTPSPFPPGTLLKFEIRIQDEQSVLAGVGRVVWKRESNEVSGEMPAGMGVKFIKIDDKSKSLIQRLVEAQGGGTSAFEAGKSGDGSGVPMEDSPDDAAAAAAPAAAGAPTVPRATPGPQKRASTILGLGGLGGKAGEAKKDAGAGSFFPKTDPDKEMPPPEERTVMKQAAELLKQALAEAGASMDEIGSAGPAPAATPAVAKEAAKPAEEPKPKVAEAPPAVEKEEKPKVAEAKPAAPAPVVVKEDKPSEVVKATDPIPEDRLHHQPTSTPAPSSVKEADKSRPRPAEVKSVRPKPPVDDPANFPVKPLLMPQEDSNPSGRRLTILLIAAGLAGAGWLLLGRNNDPGHSGTAPTATQAAASAAPTTALTATATATAATPAPTEIPSASASASPSASATASAATSAVPAPSGAASAATTTSASAAPTTKATAAPKPPPAAAPPRPPPAAPPAAPPPKPKGDDPYG